MSKRPRGFVATEKMVSAYEAGTSVQALARRFDIPSMSMYAALLRAGVKIRQSGWRKAPEVPCPHCGKRASEPLQAAEQPDWSEDVRV